MECASTIIGLKRTAEGLNTIPITTNTFGWSAEEVLYRVFDVRTTRNSYLEMELRELLHGIATGDASNDRMKAIVKNIEALELSVNDPLNIVVERAKKLLND